MGEQGHTRAQFLGTGAALGGAALASTWRRPEEASAQEIETLAGPRQTVSEGAFGPAPTFDGEHFFFEFDDGSPGAFVSEVQGGEAYADVIVDDGSGGTFAKKVPGNLKWNDISIKCGASRVQSFYPWIKASFDRAAQMKSGTIKACDADFRVTQVGSFTNALITEVGFPALDAAAKNPAYITIKFSPEHTSQASGSGRVSKAGSTAGQVSFKFAPEGLSSARVSKIDAFTVKQQISEAREPGKIEFPNLKVTLSEGTGLDSWLAWHEDFLINGNHDDGNEKTAALTFFKGSRAIHSFEVQHLGVFKGTPEKLEAGSETIRRVAFEMYCENIAANFSS